MKCLTLPWSKSITNRDLILASLVQWTTILKWYLESDDTKYMIQALQNFWVSIIKKENWELHITWWINKLKIPEVDIDLWQSGTSLRFLIWLAVLICEKCNDTSWKWITFIGEKRLLERPLQDLLDWIEQLWIITEHTLWEYVKIKSPTSPLLKGKAKNNIVKMNGNSSSQFFTALLHIAPFIEWWLNIEVEWDLVSKPYIDITINEMKKFWCDVQNKNYKQFSSSPPSPSGYFPPRGGRWQIQQFLVEWDASALSYIANYICLHWWEITINNIGKNSKQWDYKYLEMLQIFWLEYISDGSSVILKNNVGYEYFHTLPTPTPSPSLVRRGVRLEKFDFENMPDVSMSFMIMALFLPWMTQITGLQTLNLKECKRIDVMKNELRKLWVEVESDEKSIKITSPPNPLSFRGEGEIKINIETYNDHRIAMCFWILHTLMWNLNILNKDCVSKTYPKFWEDLEYIKSP